MGNPVVDVTDETPVVIVVEEGDNVIVTVSGEGPRGPVGGVGPDHFTFNQGAPSAKWTVQHNLGKQPSVTVFDSAKTQIEGDVEHISANELTITFGAAFSGVAYLN